MSNGEIARLLGMKESVVADYRTNNEGKFKYLRRMAYNTRRTQV